MTCAATATLTPTATATEAAAEMASSCPAAVVVVAISASSPLLSSLSTFSLIMQFAALWFSALCCDLAFVVAVVVVVGFCFRLVSVSFFAGVNNAQFCKERGEEERV